MERYLIAALVALSAATVCSTSVADVGWMDGEDTFSRLQSSGSSADTQRETGSIDYSPAVTVEPFVTGRSINSDVGDTGARGVSGSRYSARTRQEVTDELIEHQRTNPNPPRPGDLYFGG